MKTLLMASLVTGSQLQLSWSTNAAAYALESTDYLPASHWKAVTNDAVVIGEQMRITIRTEGGSQFYRLHKP